MGLLDRAIALSSKEQAREVTTIEALASSTPDTPGYPNPQGIINAFRELIGFAWGSIMLLDSERGEYHPLISTESNFNASNGPRIKSNLLTPHFDEADQIATAKFETLLPNLSGVDPKGEIMVLRIGTGNPPLAILVANDYQWSGDHSMKTKFRQLADMFQDKIESYVSAEGGETAFSKRLKDAGIDKAMAVFLDMSDAIETISEYYPELDTVAKEVNNLLERITGRMGRFHNLEGERVLIVFPYERLPDHTLYLHQLSASFGLAYKKLNRTLDFQAEFKLWPNDRIYIEKQLSS